jgi:nucleotide-binding universal stress UspA family protein
MKKIIAAFDGLKFSDGAKDYAVHFAKITKAHLVNIFLHDVTYHTYKLSEVLDDEGMLTEKRKINLELIDDERRKVAETYFEEYCQQEGVNFSIHHNRMIAIQELLRETVYSDLLIIDADETFSSHHEEPPTRFIRDLLADAHCPALVVPKKYKPIEKIILLYDGEPSSVHAIKMFSYILSAIKYLPIEVVSVKGEKESLHLPENKLMREYMKRHFPNAIYSVLKGEAQSEIVSHLHQQKENILVVLGAYGRGMVSQWFKNSMADTLMKEFKIPLFIAHE